MVHSTWELQKIHFRRVSKEEVDRQLLRNFLPTDKVVIEQNIPLFTLGGGQKILFETGLGHSRCLDRILVVFNQLTRGSNRSKVD
jgi:hypothetical protein